MPYSHHSHSGQFCKHAVGNLEDIVLKAIEDGYEVYGLTEHVPRYRTEDLYPEEVEADLSLDHLVAQFNAFLAEAHRLKDKYAGQIRLLVGLETELITDADSSGLSALLEKHGDRIQYIVGSVHHVNGIPIDFDQPTFLKSLSSFAPAPLSEPPSSVDLDPAITTAFLCSYFNAQYELLQRFRPEVIGHFDLCRLYTPALQFSSFPDALALIRRNIAFAVSYGALFELNAAAFRKGWDSAYPGADVVEIILAAGGHFTLSDDSHGPHAVGLNYRRLVQYARRVGINELWVLDCSGSERNVAGRPGIANKVQGVWWEHEFWKRLELRGTA